MSFVAASSNPYATPLFLVSRANTSEKRRQLAKEEWEEIAFAFNTMDHDKTGLVTARQLKVTLRAMGFPLKKAEVLELLKRYIDDDERDKIDFDTFKTVVAEKLGERTAQDDMRRAFRLLDVHETGKLDALTLRKVTKSLGMEIGDAELQDMIAEFDLDKDGMINEAEFMAIMDATQD